MAKGSPRQAKETATSPPPNKRTELEVRRDYMKAINAHYRKHKTLDGMPGSVPAAMIAKARGDLEVWGRFGYNTDKPFPSYEFTRIGARIRQAAARAATVERDQAIPASEETIGTATVTVDPDQDRVTPMQGLADLTKRAGGVPKSEFSPKPKAARKRKQHG